LRQVRATRYVTPLREGGSLPGIVEADDLGIYVCKFRGAGHGLRVLAASGSTSASTCCRFGFLRTPRSTVVQPGPVHGGLTDDPAAELHRLLEALVG
jgi:hypothetical protein